MYIFFQFKFQTSENSQNAAAPLVKIQPVDPSYDTDVTNLSEYDIPLDPAWEFPRDK